MLLQCESSFLAGWKVVGQGRICISGSESGDVVSQGGMCNPGQPCPAAAILYRVSFRPVFHAVMMKFNQFPNE